jgi:glycosyltransferase involved in cell wall biosynthesis
MKVDLVTWTYNSARVLDKSLASIDKAIPENCICHKVAVDGGSIDSTSDILRRHGWLVENAPKKGIPYQANHALGKVDTEFFASFEHDIILNPSWFQRTSRMILSKDGIGAVQGIRLYTGSKTMKAVEEWAYRANRIPRWVYSIDNTLLRTEAVRAAGGFSDECMASADGILRRNMFLHGYTWITDSTLVSGHYRKDFLEQFRHQIKAFELARYYWSYNPEVSVPRRIISMFGGNPIHVIRMTRQGRMLRIPLAWYVLRLERGLYMSLPHEGKAVKPVAMDDWHLREFLKTVRESSEPLPSGNLEIGEPASSKFARNRCVWCGQLANFAYRIPYDWGSILPKFSSKMRQRFYACSPEHAEKIAEIVFKDAFEYVTPGEAA